MFNLNLMLNDMKIRLQNLGPIPDASIDLTKRLTLFCGPNNTGKTYVSYIVYALTSILLRNNGIVQDEQIAELQNEGKICVQIDVDALLSLRVSVIDRVKQTLGEIYGLPDEKVFSFFDNVDVSFDELDEEFLSKIKKSAFELLCYETSSLKIIAEKIADENKIVVTYEGSVVVDHEYFRDVLKNRVMPVIYHCMAIYPLFSATILPVERIATQVFSRELMAARLSSQDDSSVSTVVPAKVARYPLAVWHQLLHDNSLSSQQNTLSQFADLADELEDTMLHGRFSVDSNGDAVFNTEGTETKALPIKMTASMVKSLSALTFYLRYNATVNNLLIIDEPELNLHPDSQIKLARIFGKMLSRGIRLMISTHSDYIIRELNNMIMLSSLSDTALVNAEHEFGYDGDLVIHREDVVAYLFKCDEASGKTVVSEIPITREGFEVTTIDDTLRKLNQSAQQIYYMLDE